MNGNLHSEQLYNIDDEVMLNNKNEKIYDHKYHAWTGHFYKIYGDNKWYHQGCFYNAT